MVKVDKEINEIKRGDIIEDEDGDRWYVTGISYMNGQIKISKVREGSLAHIIIAKDDSQKETNG